MITRRQRTVTPASRTISAGTAITSGVAKRTAPRQKSAIVASMRQMTPEKAAFARQLQQNVRRMSITAATNTANIAAKPDFLELLPMFVQKLIVLDVFGAVAMKSRQQLIPYFKFVAENTKGETAAGTVLSSPFVNAQGKDPNFTGKIVKNESVLGSALVYVPVLAGSVTVSATKDGVTTKYIDNGAGGFVNASGEAVNAASIDYATGAILGIEGDIVATYQYDNETVGPDAAGNYGAQMAKGYLQLDEINMVAEAHELACYWSVYSAFAAQQEYGGNIGDIAKEAAFSELTAEINETGFQKLLEAASYKPQFNWDASPVLSGAVVPSDYLNMFKLKLGQAAASIYQATRLSRPNRIVCGSTCAEYIAMINGFKADNVEDTVGPYHFGTLDQFEVYVDPNYEVNTWVMCCKSNDIRRNSALFGEYMPMTSTDAIGLANASVQQGYCWMGAFEVVNPATVVSGKILGTF